MNVIAIVVLLTLTTLAGCASTADLSQANAASSEIKSKLDSGKELTDKEITELAGKANFSATQLKKAAKKLGYKCTYFASTGTHIKKKICSTQQQRDVRAEAAKAYVSHITSANRAPTSL